MIRVRRDSQQHHSTIHLNHIINTHQQSNSGPRLQQPQAQHQELVSEQEARTAAAGAQQFKMRPLDVSNGSNLPSYVNGGEPKGKLQVYWEAQSQRAREFWVNMDWEGRMAIAGIATLLALSVGTVMLGPTRENQVYNPNLNAGDTAWLMTCTALVLLMTPGLAFFYGGMVDRKNILYTMFQSISAIAIVTCLWTFVGFSLAFGDDVGHVIGNPATFFLYDHVGAQPHEELSPTIPLGLFSLFQLKFAIITPPIISGAFTERIAYLPYMAFIILFSVLVYCPIVHSTWHSEGFLRRWGVIDFAGGLAVETASGYAALAGSIVFNNRGGAHEHRNNAPHIPFIVLGTSLLWFGWFGFNSGSALRADGLAMQSFLNTNCAASSAMITWLLVDKVRGLKPSVTAACVGAVVGLVSITPACGFVNVGGAFVIGVVSAILCNMCCELVKASAHVDDQLDVFPAHGLGGTIGTIMTGMLADKNVNYQGAWGLFYGGTEVFWKNLVASIGVAIYAFVMAYALFRLIGRFVDLHVPYEKRMLGLDVSFHGESVVNSGRGTFARNFSQSNLNGVPEHSKHGGSVDDDEDYDEDDI